MNPFDITGRRALVTGASSGLGRHFAHVLAAAGATVMLAARRLDRLAAVAEEINAAGGAAQIMALDLEAHDRVAGQIEFAGEALGGLDILINNAGITRSKPLLDHDIDDWRQVIDVNLTGAWLAAQAAARIMAAAGGGSIVNIASIAGQRTMNQVPAYAASKAGLIHLTRTMAMELGRSGVRVNAIAPGLFESELAAGFLASERGTAMLARVPMGRAGRHAELDGPLLLLASDAGSYMTGCVLTVDGGHVVSAL